MKVQPADLFRARIALPPARRMAAMCAGRAAVVLVATAAGSAQALPIYAGPAVSPTQMPRIGPGSINNVGVAVVPQGTMSYRWSPTLAPQRLSGLIVNGVEQPVVVSLINNAGVSAGVSFNGNGEEGASVVRYPAGGTSPSALGGLAVFQNAQSFALAINDAGAIAGSSDAMSELRAVRWNAGATTPTQLDGLGPGGTGLAEAYVINNAGMTAGVAEKVVNDVSQGLRAVRWAAGGTTPLELTPLSTDAAGMSDDFIYGINASGVVVGHSRRFSGDADLGLRAVRWNAGGSAVTELQSLGVDPDGVSNAVALSINDAGVTAGAAEKYSGDTALGLRPVRWNAAGVVTELQTFNPGPGAFSTGSALDINARGVVAGRADRADGTSRAAIWLAGSTMPLDVNTLLPAGSGWTLTSLGALTDTGFVAGVGTFDPGGGQPAYQRAFSMLVPQAGTYGLGDANFDTLINFDDLLLLAQRYGQANPALGLNVADFNLDGITDFNDLLLLAQNYGPGVGAITLDADLVGEAFLADWSTARSLLPEPALATGLGLAAGMTRGRRRV